MKKHLFAVLFAVHMTLAFSAFTPVYAASTSTMENAGEKTGVEAGLAALRAQDYDAARAAFTAAAAHGDPVGYYHLGAMLQRGLGGRRSETKALDNYRKAAEQNVTEAEFALGLFYQHGKAFLQKNPDIAVAWYTKAAAHGSVAAKYNLGMMYATGEAVPVAYGSNPDYIKARGWFLVTLDGMESPSDKAKIQAVLTELEGHMTAGQIARSEKYRDEILAAKP